MLKTDFSGYKKKLGWHKKLRTTALKCSPVVTGLSAANM